MTIVSLGVFALASFGLALLLAGGLARSRVVPILGTAFLLPAIALLLGIRSACAGDGC
jgi:hypothetical protein